MDRDRFRRNLSLLRRTQGCSRCGTHDEPLVHHHLVPATKRIGLSKMQHYSLEAFMDELAKCTVVCKSCHRTIHNEGVSNATAA